MKFTPLVTGQGMFADFSTLWLLIHQSRFGKAGSPSSDCALERWREKGREQGVKARDRLRDGVEQALILLGEGFLLHRDNAALVHALETGVLDDKGYFQELLRIVYRFIFLFVAEDRGLLRWKAQEETAEARLYAEGYSLTRLRTKAVRSLARDHHHDFWEGVRIVFRGLARGEKRLALPALGGLFAPDRTPHLDQAVIENRYLLAAVEHLAWIREEGTRLRVNWRDMETEELGSVYESLLELMPRASASERTFSFAQGAETTGNARKTSGSYYTPDSLVQLLLNSALAPLIEETVAKNPGCEVEALLALDVLDPACGSGHFLLAAARRLAARIAQLRSPGSPSADDYRHALREAARHCLYGVDRNPMAVELCKVALWIETVEPGKPLSFLDNRIRQGDSLIGIFDLNMLAAGIPDEAYKALTGDDRTVASHYRKLNKAQRDGTKDQHRLAFAGAPTDLSDAFAAVDAMPEDDVDQVAAKAVADAAARGKPGWWQLKTACDLLVSTFFVPKTGQLPDRAKGIRGDTDQRIPTTDAVWRAAQGEAANHQLVGQAVDLAGAISAFHWPLEFPDVMRKGGFDSVIGNPPWEVSQLNEIEYFASRRPELSALTGSKRKAAIRELESESSRLWTEYVLCKRGVEASNEFFRSAGRYPLGARGKINTFSLFAELFSRALSECGYSGFVVPSGIATDSTTAELFSSFVSGQRLRSFFEFENAGFFASAGQGHMVRFALATLGPLGSSRSADFFFQGGSLGELSLKDRHFTMTQSDIELINPNTKTSGIFITGYDAQLTKSIYRRVPALIVDGPPGHNPWKLVFRQGVFNMTSDSALFKTAVELTNLRATRDGPFWLGQDGCCWLPLYESKMLSLYNYRHGDYSTVPNGERSHRLPSPSLAALNDPSFEVMPFYWVRDHDVRAKLDDVNWSRDWLIGWRDVTDARASARTVIASILPRCGCGDTVLLMFPSECFIQHVPALVANLSSLVLDYAARQKLGGLHLKYNVMKQLPIIAPESYKSQDLRFVNSRVVELTYTSHSMVAFARGVGYDGQPFRWDEDRRAWLRAELDAYYARLYGLTREELLYILDPTFVKGPDYPSETFRVLRKNEEAEYGEYRTARLVMQAWDELDAKGKVA
jgi:hypothetical protein